MARQEYRSAILGDVVRSPKGSPVKNSAVHRLRLVSMPEGLSFVLLLICTVLKYTTSFNAVPVLGMLHGILFIFYVVFALWAWYAQRWTFQHAAWVLVLSVIPGGGFYAERLMAREEREGLETPAVAV
jgi:integral membrane protein